MADPGTGLENLYLWERRTGKVRLITRSAAPISPIQRVRSSSPSISADGRYVAFLSTAPDLVPGQGETGTSSLNVFLFDRVTGRTAVVDHIATSATVPGSGIGSSEARPRITADGRFVVYESRAQNLIAGQSASGPGSTSNVFLYERATGKNVLVSRALSSPTATAAGFSGTGIPSADGSFILFASTATNLVPGQVETPNPTLAVFLYTRSTGKITLVSGANGSAPTPASASSFAVAISGNGDTALFGSGAWDVVPGVVDENNSASDLFLWDRREGEPVLTSNFCEALLRMQPPEERSSLILSCTWAPGLPLSSPDVAPGEVAFRREHFPVIEKIFQKLQPAEEPTPDLFVGYVDSLNGEMGADGRMQGEVTLLLLHEESPLRARADLSPEQYRTANDAHMAGDVVAVQGILHRGRRAHRLTDVTSVRRVESGASSR